MDRISQTKVASLDSGEAVAFSEGKGDVSERGGESPPAVSAANSAGSLPIDSDAEATLSSSTTEILDPSISQENPKSSKVEFLFEELGLKTGDEVGRYLLLAPLGAGGMGVVFAAFDPDLNRKVALKFIREGEEGSLSASRSWVETRSRLMQEAQFMAQLSHPNVVAIYDVGEVHSHVYLAMEMIEGQTLKAWIRAGGYKWTKAVDLLIRAGKGLASAHDAGLVHRDFKPDNVLLGPDHQVCVADFGLVYQQISPASIKDMNWNAGSVTLPSTTTKQVLGTPSYMSPEQHRGDLATALSDQFSYCVCLYEAVYGVKPFLGRTLNEIARAIESGNLTIPTDGRKVPRWLHKIILRGLSPNPIDRFPSMHDLLAGLAVDRESKRKKKLSIVAVSLLSIAGMSSLEVWSQGQDQECQSGLLMADELWSKELRSKVQQQFLGSGLGYANSAWNHVDTSLSQRSQQWREVYTEVCQVSDRDKMQIDHDLKLACLNQRAEQMQTLVGLLASADKTTIERSMVSTKDLAPITDCLNEETLKDKADLPLDPRMRRIVVDIERKLDRPKLLQSIGKLHEAAEQGQLLFEEARPTRHTPILAETSFLLAKIYTEIEDNRQAGEWLTTAMKYAEQGKNEILSAKIANVGIFVYGYRLRQSDQVDAWISHAKAHLLRAGNSSLIRAKWLSMSGAAYGGNGRMEESEGVIREAVDIYERELGSNHPDTLSASNNLGYTLYTLRRFEEAESIYRRIIAIAGANYGRLHPFLSLPVSNLATLLNESGRYEETIEFAEQLVDIAEASQGTDNVNASPIYIHRATVLFHADRFFRAIEEWRRVIATLERVNGKHEQLPFCYASLARAHLRLGDTVEASIQLSQIDLNRRGPRDGEGWILPFLVGIELAMATEDLAKAQDIFLSMTRKAGDIFSFQHDANGEISLLAGDLEMDREQPQLAFSHYRRALKRAKDKYPGEINTNLFPYREALARAEAALEDSREDELVGGS